jgi:UDP-N-acetylmuramoyl-L-alanyl-D-glutamate--2,6-diaminopimelate ligase
MMHSGVIQICVNLRNLRTLLFFSVADSEYVRPNSTWQVLPKAVLTDCRKSAEFRNSANLGIRMISSLGSLHARDGRMTSASPYAMRPTPVGPRLTTNTVRLRTLFPAATFRQTDDVSVSDFTERSQECRPGCLFAAIPGTKTDGTEFIGDAVSRGAAALLVNRPIPEVAVPQCIVTDARDAFARLCGAAYGQPSRTLNVAGVTGTNGKTTVAWMIRAILQHADRRCGLLGTVDYDDSVLTEPSRLTTPDSKSFAEWLARMAANGATHAAVELSSHALHQNRVAGTELAAAVITNITQDHFDYHQNFTHYQVSKARIAQLLRPKTPLVLNLDDLGSWGVREFLPANIEVVSFSQREPADVTAQIISESLSGTSFRLSLHGDSAVCESPLIGRHNIENCLAAAAACSVLGVSLPDIVAALHEFRGAPGRLERITCGQRFEVFVDYAHTDDALRRCLHSLRSVICVFGAGGDRDRTKRPLLGKASQLADVPIVTSDNPRTEIPSRIAEDIVAGFSVSGPPPRVELDRAAAIRLALRLARPGDSVLIAGKGHENEQIFRDHRIPFDDRRIARQALFELSSSETHDVARPA